MIETAYSPISGNAAMISIASDADLVRVLRRPDNAFAGAGDPAAALIYQGPPCLVVDTGARNGVTAWYKAYSSTDDGNTWFDEGDFPVVVEPASDYTSVGPDVRTLLQSRVELGLADERARELLRIKSDAPIRVLPAPPKVDTTSWPVGSVLVDADMPGERGIGETLAGIGDDESESMLRAMTITIGLWSQDPEERHRLHESLFRILCANLPVLSAVGLTKIDWRLNDANFTNGEFGAAVVYAVQAIINCSAPAGVAARSTYPIINDIEVSAAAVLPPTYVPDTGA